MRHPQTSKRARPSSQRNRAASLCLLLSLLLMAGACARTTQPGTNSGRTPSGPVAADGTAPTSQEAPIAMPQSVTHAAAGAQPSPANAKTSIRPPTLAEAQSAVARIYKNALTVETGAGSGVDDGNTFITGDFNGDGSQDIAVTVRPAKGMLPTLNRELSNWIVEDVTKVALPVERNGAQVLPPNTGPVKIEPNDRLLAVIHGYREEGWRNPQAQQTYLLKNAAGEHMRAQPIKYALAGVSGRNPHLSINGDVIKETTDKGEGFIYWTGSTYAWQQ